MGGELDGGSSTIVSVRVNTNGISEGTYAAALVLSSNDPDNGLVSIPVVMHVGEFFVNAASAGAVYYSGDTAEVSWQLADPQAAMSVDLLLSTNGGASFEYVIAEELSPTVSYSWQLPTPTAKNAGCRL